MRLTAVEIDPTSYSVAIRFISRSRSYMLKQMEQRSGEYIPVASPAKEEDRMWNTYRVIKLNDTTYRHERDDELLFLTEPHPLFNLEVFVLFTRHLLKDDIRIKISVGSRNQLYKLVRDSKAYERLVKGSVELSKTR
jgi:hypothetical protein